MRLRFVLVAVLLCAGLGLGAGTSTAAAPRSDARAFVRATLAFDLARGRAIGRAERLGDTRRRNATVCLQSLRAAPVARREELFRLYSTWVGAGYFTEDEPIFARWVRRLKAIRTADPALRRLRAELGRELRTARAIYGQGRRFCSPVRAWALAGWTMATAPRPVRRLATLLAASDGPRGVPEAAGANVVRRHGGTGGQLAADVLRAGVDEPDELILERGDPVVALLRP